MGDVAVNGKVLEWARLERRLSPEEAAKRLGISVTDLHALENGKRKPNVTELRKIANKYQITFAALLMPEPLPSVTRPSVKDFRTLDGRDADLDHDMIVELEDVSQRLTLMSELKEVAPEFFGTRSLTVARVADDPQVLAANERREFGVPIERQLGWQTERHAFLTFRDLIEARGIFVYARNLGPPTNCRGFSLLDERDLPTIVVNSNKEEEYGPRNFTLLHEYAHVLLRETGISDENRQNRHERFCNQFAADFLMPRASFRNEATQIRAGASAWTDAHVGRLAKRFKVSKTAAAIHLETTGLARPGFYEALKAQWHGRAKRAGGGISTYPEKMVNRHGTRHVGLVLRALDEHKINELDASEMLEAKTQYFEELRKEARERHEAYGGGR